MRVDATASQAADSIRVFPSPTKSSVKETALYVIRSDLLFPEGNKDRAVGLTIHHKQHSHELTGAPRCQDALSHAPKQLVYNSNQDPSNSKMVTVDGM
jgi:hypothetical protein